MSITTVSSHVVSVNAIQGTLIADNAITAVHIATNAVSGTLIADNAVTATHIAQNTITVTQIADDAIEAPKIADGVITTNHLNKAMISSQTEVTAVAGDFLLIGDTSDSNNLKKIPISGIVSLAGVAGISSSADATAITIDSSEKVGIGKTPSTWHLDVDSSGTNVASFDGSNNTGVVINSSSSIADIIGYSNSASSYNALNIRGASGTGLVVDTSNRVGIGTASPGNNHSKANNLVVGSGSAGGMAIYNGTSEGWYAFSRDNADNTDAYDGGMSYTNRVLTFHVNSGTERLRIDGEGNLSFGTQKVDPNWSQFFNALSGNYGGHLSFQNNNVPVTSLGNNFYINNSTANERVLAYPAQQFKLDHQQNFLWESAASGTAGATFSFTEKMRLNANGTLMIGTATNPSYNHKLYAVGSAIPDGIAHFRDVDNTVALSNSLLSLQFSGDNDATSGSFVYMTDGNGAIGSITAASGTSVSFNTTSDERLKKNIVDASPQLDIIKSIKVREFDWKRNDHHELGLIAQEIEDTIPNVVQEGGDDETKHPFGVDYGKLTPYLIKAMQEQQTIIEDLKSRIETLEG